MMTIPTAPVLSAEATAIVQQTLAELGADFDVVRTELPLGGRGKSREPARAIAEEGERVLAALPKQALVVALDERGKGWTSVELSKQLAQWSQTECGSTYGN